MTEIERLKKELEEIKQELATLKEGSRAYKALDQERADLEAKLIGAGAIAQGDGAMAAGERAVLADGDIDSSVIVTGDGNEVNVGTGPRAKKESLREAYLTYLFEQVSQLAISGVARQSASRAETSLNLSSIYIGLRAGENAEELVRRLAERIRNYQENPQAVDDKMEEAGIKDRQITAKDFIKVTALWYLNDNKRLMLLGAPGSGKSTFVNFVVLCMAGELLGRTDVNFETLTQPLPLDRNELQVFGIKDDEPIPQSWDHGALIPVRVILRDFAARGLPAEGEKATSEHVWNFIENELRDSGLGEFAPLLKKEMRDKGGLVCFDGLDEVPEAENRRRQMLTALESFSAVFPRCRFLVTCRTYAYQKQEWQLNNFKSIELKPFKRVQIAGFVDRWYAHIFNLRNQNPEDGKGKAEVLKRAIFANDRLMSLAESPLLLTLMASIHAWRGGTLPDKRQELYADAVDLLLDWWESQRVVRDAKGNITVIQPSLAEWLNVDRKKVRDLLNQLAYEAHKGQSQLTGTADVSEDSLVNGLMKLNPSLDVKPARLIEYLRDRAGLLIPRGVGVYTFPHRTFQEYLAACYLTDHEYPDLVAQLARSEPNRWREVALLAGAKAAGGAAVFALWSLVDALSPERENGQADASYWGAQIAGQAVTEIADLERVSDSTQPKVDRLRTRLLDILEGNRLPPVERVQAGVNLSSLGDPRFNPDLWQLPADDTLGFTLIPAGKFLMGSADKDERADEREKPQHEVDLPEYWMAKYPVTVAQFRRFVELTNHSFKEWRWNQVSYAPIVAVTWYDALEYTKWLDEQLRGYAEKQVRAGVRNALWQGLAENNLRVTLPSEAEWEKAARGTDGRVYPWAGEFDLENANTSETKIGDRSVVGCFPNGKSPYGLLDMSGNVWEWTRSLWGKDWGEPSFKYPYDPKDTVRENLEAEKEILRVLRGGSFLDRAEFARCASRDWDNPDSRGRICGFRIVVSPFLPSS